MYCKSCGEKLNEGSVFCHKCGFNQKEEIKEFTNNNYKIADNEEKPTSWYELDNSYKKNLKKEFKYIYSSGIGLEFLVIILYIFGIIAALFCFGQYTIKVLNLTVASGTYISIPILFIAIFFFTIGTIVGLVNNSKFDKAFSSWLLAKKNILK